jgi:anti-sigma factor RsiW
MDELTCRELVELVTDYLEGALDDDVRRRVDRHLAGCPGCSAYIDEMRVTIRITGTLTEWDLEPGVRDALLEAFRGVT